MKEGYAARRGRRGVAGIVAIVIIFAIMFTVGTSYFIFVNAQNASYVSNLMAATNKEQGSRTESLSITTFLDGDGDVGFSVNNTSSMTVNMTSALVISSSGTLLQCDGVGFPAGAGCGNTTPPLWAVLDTSAGSSDYDTGYVYAAGTTDTVKVLTARGNTFSETYPEPASQTGSTQSVTVNLDNLKWVQLIPQSSSLTQKKYVANCNAASCAVSFSSNVKAADILVDAASWANQAPPASVPTDSYNDVFTLGSSASVTVPTSTSVVQSASTSCNAATCGLAFGSHVVSGHTLVYALGWANQSPPSSPSDTLGDTFTVGSSQSVTVNPPTPALVQHGYLANCGSSTCALAYSSSVTSGDTLVLGLGWPSAKVFNYVPITITNSQSSATPTPFQQMVTWDPATYSAYEATNLGNVRFCADVACATTLYGWLESCSSTCSTSGSTSTSATAWVRLASSIAGSGGTLTIYMVFSPTSTNFDGVYWGEAPQLSGTYAQYDNGASVFTNYWNFSGTGCPTGWTCSGTTINNGISAASAASYAYTTSTYGLTSTMLDFYGTFPTATSVYNAGFGYNHDTPNGPTVMWTINTNTGGSGCGSTSACPQTATSGGAYHYLTAFTTTGAQVYSIYWGSSSSATAYYGYSNSATSTTDIPTTALSIGIFNAQGNQATIGPYNWLRIRAYPPSGVMPSVSLGSFTASSLAYVPILLTNSQTSATANPFQQMITWNPSTYSSYEATNLGNVRFCADTVCNSPLYSWLESCSSTCSTSGSSSTSATAWVDLTSSIAANGGTLTIYMVFGPTTTSFDGVYWGEAPQLSGTYAQYDNGANVFTFYDDFAGTTLSNLWTNNVGNAGGTLTINNGMSYTIGASGNNYAFLYSTSTFSQGVYETYGTIPAGGASGSYTYAGFGIGSAANANNGAGVGDWNSGYGLYTGTGSADTIVTGLSGGTYVWSVFVPSASPSSVSGSQNYGSTLTSSSHMPTTPANIMFLDQYNTGKNLGPFNWARDRVYPPKGVMPATSFQSAVAGVGTPTSVTDTLGDAFTLGPSQSATNGANTYETGIWYATASASGADTITATFGAAVSGSVSIYEIAGYSTSAPMSSSGSSAAGSTSASVGSFTPSSNSFVVGNVETGSATTKYTVGSGYTTVATGSGGCDASDASQGCDEYESGLGSATTTPFTLSTSTPWAEASMSFAPATANTYYSYIWYTTAKSSAADTISATFGSTVAGSVSIYEISGVTATGLIPSYGSSASSQSATAVSSITPTSGSIVVGSAESGSTTYTAGSGYTLAGAGSCTAVLGCGEYLTSGGSATTVPMSMSPSTPWVEAAVAFPPTTNTYYSYIWYATAGVTGSDTITTTFGATVAASISIYDATGYTTSGALSSSGMSVTGSTSAAVTAFTPSSDSFIVGTTEGASGSTTFTAGSGFALVGTCNSVGGCSEYVAGGGGSANTVPMTLGSSTPWVESAMAFSTPFNPQSGIQVGGYPTMGVPSGASLVWEVTFTNVDPQHRAVTIWPQTELAIGSAEFDGFDTDYTQAHYYIVSGLNPGSTTVNAYSITSLVTLAYDVPTTLYFAATAALGSTTQAFGTNVLTPFEAYFAMTGMFSDGTLYGETIPYPYGIITQANAYTTPTAGSTGNTVTVSCTSPCDFNANSKAVVGWINSVGQMTQLTSFTTTASGNIPAGVTFSVPSATAGYYTIEVTDYTNSIFMTFQHT